MESCLVNVLIFFHRWYFLVKTQIQSNLTDCVYKRGELSFSDKGFLRIKVKKDWNENDKQDWCKTSFICRGEHILNIVMLFAHNNPHLWVQSTFMSLWFYSVICTNVTWLKLLSIAYKPHVLKEIENPSRWVGLGAGG